MPVKETNNILVNAIIQLDKDTDGDPKNAQKNMKKQKTKYHMFKSNLSW